MAKVLVTKPVPQEGIDLLEREFYVDINLEDRVLTKTEFIRRLEGCEGVFCLLTDIVDDEVLSAVDGLKVVANMAVGFDNIDIEAATRHGVMVCNTPGVLTDTTADLTWALLMAVARRLVEGDTYLRQGKFEIWGPLLLLGGDVHGKTLGLIGLGRIGQQVAWRASGFDMKVIYYDVFRNEEAERELGIEYMAMDDILKEADFVSLHVPLTEDTTHLLDKRAFSMMKKTAYLVNTSRGPVIDEKALVEALKNGDIAGAGLDVYENEPELEEGLKGLKNTVILPHIGSASIETRNRMAALTAENIITALKGKKPSCLVNTEVMDVLGR